MSDRDQGRPAGGTFRQRLDAVLRRRDPAALRTFLVEAGQWDPAARTDDEAAMWMMIAASPVLGDLHAEAERWLMAHGHEHEARAILGGRARGTTGARGSRPKPGPGPGHAGHGKGSQGSQRAHGAHGAQGAHGGSSPRQGQPPRPPRHRDHPGGREKSRPES